jgi:hypothetical protein
MQMTGRRAVYWGQYATPFPGSQFFNEAKQEGILLPERWSEYVTTNMNFVPKSLLDDVPVRNRICLWPWDKLLCRVELNSALRTQGMLPNTSVTAPKVYELIDGKRTVRAIANEIVRRHGTLPKVTLQEAVKVVITLAQLGLISSAKPNGHTKSYGLRWLCDFAIALLKQLAGRTVTTFNRKA